jgi:hypothetical protein
MQGYKTILVLPCDEQQNWRKDVTTAAKIGFHVRRHAGILRLEPISRLGLEQPRQVSARLGQRLCWNAATKWMNGADGVLRRKPITGVADCARAASGHAAATPPTGVMNSRRFS